MNDLPSIDPIGAEAVDLQSQTSASQADTSGQLVGEAGGVTFTIDPATLQSIGNIARILEQNVDSAGNIVDASDLSYSDVRRAVAFFKNVTTDINAGGYSGREGNEATVNFLNSIEQDLISLKHAIQQGGAAPETIGDLAGTLNTFVGLFFDTPAPTLPDPTPIESEIGVTPDSGVEFPLPEGVEATSPFTEVQLEQLDVLGGTASQIHTFPPAERSDVLGSTLEAILALIEEAGTDAGGGSVDGGTDLPPVEDIEVGGDSGVEIETPEVEAPEFDSATLLAEVSDVIGAIELIIEQGSPELLAEIEGRPAHELANHDDPFVSRLGEAKLAAIDLMQVGAMQPESVPGFLAGVGEDLSEILTFVAGSVVAAPGGDPTLTISDVVHASEETLRGEPPLGSLLAVAELREVVPMLTGQSLEELVPHTDFEIDRIDAENLVDFVAVESPAGNTAAIHDDDPMLTIGTSDNDEFQVGEAAVIQLDPGVTGVRVGGQDSFLSEGEAVKATIYAADGTEISSQTVDGTGDGSFTIDFPALSGGVEIAEIRIEAVGEGSDFSIEFLEQTREVEVGAGVEPTPGAPGGIDAIAFSEEFMALLIDLENFIDGNAMAFGADGGAVARLIGEAADTVTEIVADGVATPEELQDLRDDAREIHRAVFVQEGGSSAEESVFDQAKDMAVDLIDTVTRAINQVPAEGESPEPVPTPSDPAEASIAVDPELFDESQRQLLLMLEEQLRTVPMVFGVEDGELDQAVGQAFELLDEISADGRVTLNEVSRFGELIGAINEGVGAAIESWNNPEPGTVRAAIAIPGDQLNAPIQTLADIAANIAGAVTGNMDFS